MQVASSAYAPLTSSESDTFSAAIGWLTQLATGTTATIFCVIGIATVGLMMLGARLHLRRGARITLGCFVLLGAPAIASGLMTIGAGGAMPATTIETRADEPRLDLPPPNYDPYAGASLRRN